ncbi:MAG TPA: hypothetical protein VGX96_05180 [Candidatus Elarobacter sp.]|jgi:hypothetical protein|nr:hypothetical protein [Candidatus Elarobacter sp.]
MTTQTCEHDACLCTRPYSKQVQAASTERIDPNGAFCSRHCRDEAGGPHGDGGCLCGHPQCQKFAGEGIPPL